MKISGFENEQVILTELGVRIKQQRITLNLTQAQFAQRCGISLSTLVRIESGEDSKFSNYIKILNGLKMSSNLDLFIAEVQPDYKAMYKDRRERVRVKHSKALHNTHKRKWKWGEDD